MNVKRGRPLKRLKRENHLGVRLSDEELNAIKAFASAANMSVSEFIREYIFTPEKGVLFGDKKGGKDEF